MAESESRIERELKAFLLERIPSFEVPTDAPAWRRAITKLRHDALARVYLVGWPKRVVEAKPRVVWTDVLHPCDPYLIRKLRYEACPGYWVPALLYEPTELRGNAKAPVVFNPNGHHAGGKGTDYKQARCANLARRGMIAMSPEFVGMSELQADMHHNNQGHLNLTGRAGVGLFYLAMKKGLDVLLAHRNADLKRVCVTGLSGGGWQTIVLSALDARVTVSVPVAGYTAMRQRVDCKEDIGDLEQTPPDLTTVFDYQHMTAMLAPRPAMIVLNEHDDCCFATPRTKPLVYDAVRPTYEAMDAGDAFAFHSNLDPGTHNYGADNRSQLYKFLNRHFGLNTPEHDVHDESEVLPEDELRVGLPDDQETMLTLALARAREVAHRRRRPDGPDERRALRQRLAAVLRLPAYTAEGGGGETAGEHDLRLGPWTVPVTVRGGADGSRAALVIADAGRAKHPLGETVDRTTCVADVFATGENHVPPGLGMMVDAAGQRLLGIQVAQILACAEWLAGRTGGGRLRLEGHGLISATAALVTAALRPELFDELRVTWELATLNYLIQWPVRYEDAQPLFCAGLLEVADVPELRSLLEGVTYHAPGRATKTAPPAVAV